LTEGKKQTLVKYRLERANESIKAAQLLFENKLFTPAMNIPEEELISDYIGEAQRFIDKISSYLNDELAGI